MSDLPGVPLSSGFDYTDSKPGTGYCVDPRCREEGDRHLHEPYGKQRLSQRDARFIAAVERALVDIREENMQDALDVDLHAGCSDSGGPTDG